MEEFISDITKLFIIKTCCYNEKIKENKTKVEAKDIKWKNYKELRGFHSNSKKIKKICNELEDKMKLKKNNNLNTLRRIPI